MDALSNHIQTLDFTWVDWTILGIIGLSVLIGLWRGLVRESLALLTWVMSIVLALFYCTVFAQDYLQGFSTPTLRVIIAFAVIFLVVLITGTIAGRMISSLVKHSGLGGIDRLTGLLFGLLRGVLVVALLLALVNMAHLAKTPAITHSVLVPQFEHMVEWIHHRLT